MPHIDLIWGIALGSLYIGWVMWDSSTKSGAFPLQVGYLQH